MKPQIKKQQREVPTPAPSERKKDEKVWVKEWKWKDRTSFNTYPKWWGTPKEYTEEWTRETWGKFKSSDGVLDSIKHDLRSNFTKRYIQGRLWRARNLATDETVEFPDIETYYE